MMNKTQVLNSIHEFIIKNKNNFIQPDHFTTCDVPGYIVDKYGKDLYALTSKTLMEITRLNLITVGRILEDAGWLYFVHEKRRLNHGRTTNIYVKNMRRTGTYFSDPKSFYLIDLPSIHGNSLLPKNVIDINAKELSSEDIHKLIKDCNIIFNQIKNKLNSSNIEPIGA